MAIFKMHLGIGVANANQEDEVEIPDEDLAACATEDERERLIDQYLQDWMWCYIDAGIWEEAV